MSSIKSKINIQNSKVSEDSWKRAQLDQNVVGDTNPLTAEYSMFGYIYNEIANLRNEVSRLGTLVRVNNSNSPDYLELYHAHIYSLLIPVGTIVALPTWVRIENNWMECKKDIVKFYLERKAIPNKKISFELIHKLDRLYRISLLMAQQAGLGIQVSKRFDIDKAIENAITGK